MGNISIRAFPSNSSSFYNTNVVNTKICVFIILVCTLLLRELVTFSYNCAVALHTIVVDPPPKKPYVFNTCINIVDQSVHTTLKC
jgi:hypothetical protein